MFGWERKKSGSAPLCWRQMKCLQRLFSFILGLSLAILHTQVCSDCMFSASSPRGTRGDSVRCPSLTPKANDKKLCSLHWSLWKHGPCCLWKVCKLIIVRSSAFLHYSSIPLLLSECTHFQLRLVFNTTIPPAKLPCWRHGLAPNRRERAINGINKSYKHKKWVKFSLPPSLIW